MEIKRNGSTTRFVDALVIGLYNACLYTRLHEFLRSQVLYIPTTMVENYTIYTFYSRWWKIKHAWGRGGGEEIRGIWFGRYWCLNVLDCANFFPFERNEIRILGEVVKYMYMSGSKDFLYR